ncbi:guanitoxin biosynthesis L-enduracididine beta-hydroxylase GntD [Amycolatopsis sp. NPDC088138]|uniref:guanitoxin biosynthesis L-enduracididine beta-hydroxylase GntD n=1 Tax=Amycolatopsis sp. NPDC088138 TaxID=3363938 RepID=UPI0037F7D41A
MTRSDVRPGPAVLDGSARPRGQHVVRHVLSEAESHRLRDVASAAAEEYWHPEAAEFLADVHVIAQELPEGLRRAVNRARLDERAQAVVVAGNPLQESLLGATPRHWRDEDTVEALLAGFVLMLEGALLGDAIGWSTQQDGRIVTDVLPIHGMEESLVSSSSHKELTWHTEDAFSPHRADYVGLLCLRSGEPTPTTLSYVDATVLPEDVRAVLAEPRFVFAADHSHDMSLSTTGTGVTQAPVLGGPVDAPVLRIDRDFTSVAAEDDEEAKRALDHLVAHLDANLYDVLLGPGELGFIDNRNAVHGRRPFTPRYDGNDRWLKRVNLAVDLRRTRPGRVAPDTRVIG